MDEKKTLFRLAAALAALFTGSRTSEDEEIIKQWTGEDERRHALVARLADKKRFEENREALRQFPADKAWEKVKRHVTGGRYRLARRWHVARHAAAVALLLAGATGIYLLSRESGKERPPVTGIARVTGSPFFTSGTTGALLTLGDGREVNINKATTLRVTEEDGTTIVVDSSGVDYVSPVDEREETVYNVVRTPTGMEFPVVLSDGTRVHLNAESRLRFPARFTGETREVELEGEAFFTVAPDARRPFVARAGAIEVRVLGTSFNLRAYESEQAIATTLVEGSVALARGDRQWTLVPGEQARYHAATGECEIREVDVDLYTAWPAGKFIFKNERLEEILSYLSRWYGFEYEFIDDEARDVQVGASLDRYKDMEPIIRILRESRLARVMVVENKLLIQSAK
jgi:ferric-dicitrate binding protein FerR (iron transport regulator)